MEVELKQLIALNTRQTKEQTRAFVQTSPLQDYDALTQSPRRSKTTMHLLSHLD